MNEHQDFYTTFCQPQFRTIDKKLQKVLDVLKGENGDPGLCDEVRSLRIIHENKTKHLSWLTKTFIGAIIVQMLIILQEVLAKIWS